MNSHAVALAVALSYNFEIDFARNPFYGSVHDFLVIIYVYAKIIKKTSSTLKSEKNFTSYFKRKNLLCFISYTTLK